MTNEGFIKQVIKELKWVLEDPRNRIVADINKVDIYTLSVLALEKQVPKKVTVLTNENDVKIGSAIFKSGTKIYACDCNNWIGYKEVYCRYCGQKIDWD